MLLGVDYLLIIVAFLCTSNRHPHSYQVSCRREHCRLSCETCLQLGDEHGRVLLPLLVVLAVTVTLVVLLLTHWDTGYLESLLAPTTTV